MNNETNTPATIATNPLNFYGIPDSSKVEHIAPTANCKMWTAADPMPGWGDDAELAVNQCM